MSKRKPLKIYSLPVVRQKLLFGLLGNLPKGKIKWKDWGKYKGITKAEWYIFIGYLASREYRGGAKIKKQRRIVQKEVKRKLTQAQLNKLPYGEYLQTDHWARSRKSVRKSQKRCVLCNCSKGLEVHHRSYKHKCDTEKERKDLFLLCRDCHQLFHDNNRFY